MCQPVFDALKNTMSDPTAFLEISRWLEGW